MKELLKNALDAITAGDCKAAYRILKPELARQETIAASQIIEWNFDLEACPLDQLVIVSTAPSKYPADATRPWFGKRVLTKETEHGWRFTCLASNTKPLAWAHAPKHILEILK